MAVLRRDGFISVDAGEKEGMLLSKPFVAPGAKLFANVDATGGSLKVEALDDSGKVLSVSEAISGDQPRASVSWPAGKAPALKDQTISLRFKLEKAKLYSFWHEE